MKSLSPATLSPPFGKYSHGLAAGPLVVTSGQLALGADGKVPDGITAQAELCFAAVLAILAEDGLDASDVMRFSAFVTQRADMAPYMAVRDRVCADLVVKPASTLMIVSGFTRPEFLVEVEAIALRRA
ncbi:RidA family protein [Pseudooceanicola spongiae]|jgi:2-iminobutanoate/2-iminopropanoate deaminase|nr:RidA family protein [Pseudooceanicola spongiae]